MRGTTGTAQIGTRSSGKVMLLMLSPTCSGMSMVAGQPSSLFYEHELHAVHDIQYKHVHIHHIHCQ